MFQELLNDKIFDEKSKKNILNWLEGPYDESTKKEIKNLLEKDKKLLKNAFYKKLEFGTGGARGIMGVGTNRLNKYTIRGVAKGLANYLKKSNLKNLSAIIGFDNRKNSKLFAEETAKVLSKNNIKVFLFKNLRPTPIVSFGLIEKKCSCGIMITASHNPPEYNGFKVCWEDGGQVLPPHDKGIIEEVDKIEDLANIEVENIENPLIEIIDDEIDKIYLKKLSTINFNEKITKEKGNLLKIIYTNLHGTGITLIPNALKDWGFTNFSLVDKQKTIDENFTFAKIPNPEEKSALQLGIDLLIQKNADILLASDPDADRLGVVINENKNPLILTGNQIACILLEYILSNFPKIKKKRAVIKTIVTTPLFEKIAKEHNAKCFDVLTGFKYIAEKIKIFEEENFYKFTFGAEESLGYLIEDFVRDKDSISASVYLATIFLLAKLKNKRFIDLLYDLYKKYGIYREKVFSFSFEPTKEGMEKREKIMLHLRKTNKKTFANQTVVSIQDYKTKLKKNFKTNEEKTLTLPRSDVLKYTFSDESTVVIRPSGTEPKIKIYLFVCEQNFKSIEDGIKLCDERLLALENILKKELNPS
jgi:phosphoglucomutase/phosphomannomutase